MIARAGEDGPRAAAMIDTGPEAPPMSAILGGQRAPESELLTTYINLNKNLCGLILFEGSLYTHKVYFLNEGIVWLSALKLGYYVGSD